MRCSFRLEDLDRAPEVFCGDRVHSFRRERTGTLVELRRADRIVTQFDRPLGVALRLFVGTERRSSIARLHERLERVGLDGRRILVIRGGEVGVEVVGRDDLHDLVLIDRGAKVRSGSQVTRLAFALRHRVIGDLLDQILEESVLPPVGQERVDRDREDLLANERGEETRHLCFRKSRDRRESLQREGPPEHGGILQQPPLFGCEAVEPGGDQSLGASRALRASPPTPPAGMPRSPGPGCPGRSASAPSRPHRRGSPRPVRGCGCVARRGVRGRAR